MRDHVIDELVKITNEALTGADKINKKLVQIIIIQAIVLCITAIGIVAFLSGFYFLSDYQYPSVTQETSQQKGTDIKQESKQEIK